MAQQEAIVAGPQFGALPARDRARLLRLMAAEYLLRGEYPELARAWLRAAWIQAPLDLKAAFLAAVATLSGDLARHILTVWRSKKPEPVRLSPFDAASMSGRPVA